MKKTQQGLFFLGKLKWAVLFPCVPVIFYRATVERILYFHVTVWHRNCAAQKGQEGHSGRSGKWTVCASSLSEEVQKHQGYNEQTEKICRLTYTGCANKDSITLQCILKPVLLQIIRYLFSPTDLYTLCPYTFFLSPRHYRILMTCAVHSAFSTFLCSSLLCGQ